LTFPIEETFFFAQANIRPTTYTVSISVSCIINSANVKQISTNAKIIGDFKYSGKKPRLARTVKPSPMTKPKTPANNACPKKLNKFSIPNSGRVNILTTSYENKAINGPAGSTIIPSHFKTAAVLGCNFAFLSKGIITVGPVTTTSPPIIKATSKFNPARYWAAKEPNIQAINAPPVIILTTDLDTPLISRTSKLELPSNKIIATASEISGLYKSPSAAPGLITPITGPIKSPTIDIIT